MRYATAAAFRQALEQRLRNKAAETPAVGVDDENLALARLCRRVAFEAFLRRLLLAPDDVASPPERSAV